MKSKRESCWRAKGIIELIVNKVKISKGEQYIVRPLKSVERSTLATVFNQQNYSFLLRPLPPEVEPVVVPDMPLVPVEPVVVSVVPVFEVPVVPLEPEVPEPAAAVIVPGFEPVVAPVVPLEVPAFVPAVLLVVSVGELPVVPVWLPVKP